MFVVKMAAPLQINFGVVEINGAPEVSLTKDFPVYISGCSGRKRCQCYSTRKATELRSISVDIFCQPVRKGWGSIFLMSLMGKRFL